jgi:hypothetical protein
MTEHLSKGVGPFGHKGVGELRYLFGRRRVTTPHGRLGCLVLSVVWNELTKHDEKNVFSMIEYTDQRTLFGSC